MAIIHRPGPREAQLRAQREAMYEVSTVLSAEEAADLERLERQIEGSVSAFITMGRALAEIRDRRLYRATHTSFEAYCRDRWGIGKNYAGKTIRAAAAVAQLSSGTQVPELPKTERLVRPLTTLPNVEDKREAWTRALERAGGAEHVTAQHVEAAVREVRGEPVVLEGPDPRVPYVTEAVRALATARELVRDEWAERIGGVVRRLERFLVAWRKEE